MERYQDLQDTETSDFLYNFRDFREYPFFSPGGSLYFPLSLRFLKDRFTSGVYWVLFDYLKSVGGRALADKYTRFIGQVFEEYACRIFERMYPSSIALAKRFFRETDYGTKAKSGKTVDGTVLYPHCFIAVEVKKTRIKMKGTSIDADLQSYREDVVNIVGKGFKELCGTIDLFKAGSLEVAYDGLKPSEIDVYIPVIVVQDSFPMFPLLWSIIEEEAERLVPGHTSLIDNLQIIDASELELMEAMVGQGYTLKELFLGKNASPEFKRLSMINYLYYVHYKSGERKIGGYYHKRFYDFANEASLRLLGKPINVEYKSQ